MQAPLVLGRDHVGVLEEPLHFLPDRRIGAIGSQLRVGAQALTAKAMGITAAAAVIGIVALLALCGPRPNRLPLIGKAAPPAYEQSPMQVRRPRGRWRVGLRV